MNLKRITGAGAALFAAVGLGVAVAPQASALDGDCHTYSACLYYNSSGHGYGAFFEQQGDISNYGTLYRFNPGAHGTSGAGVYVKNHAAYADNWNPDRSFTVYEFSAGGGSGRIDWIARYGEADLTVTHDNNAGAKFTG
ncbi:hypothetical protein ABTX81_08590 [Kitasatospora sp. NPDC097605]|uniref:hypothetical protein n=1 Tax=Kitasatospora sp. NPDC097605 TaxID=3157226 RepID=UPI00332EF46B